MLLELHRNINMITWDYFPNVDVYMFKCQGLFCKYQVDIIKFFFARILQVTTWKSRDILETG